MKERTKDRKRQFLRKESWQTGLLVLDIRTALSKVLLSLIMHILQLSHNSEEQTHKLLVGINQ